MMAELSFEVLGWWLAITVAASWLSAFTYPLFSRWIADLSPSLQSFARLVYVGSAPVAALLSVVLVTHPSLAGLVIPGHCHGDQCGAHTPVYAQDSVILLGLAVASSLIILCSLLVLLWTLRRARRQIRALKVLTFGAAEGYRTVDTADMLACCVGLWRPQILVSRGLVDQLQPDELTVVLAHERAHAERMDNLRALLLRWLTVFWPAALKQQAIKDSRTNAEQACDLAAARSVAEPMQVASVIRKLTELCSSAVTSKKESRFGFDGENVSTRLSSLERCCKIDRSPASGWFKAIGGLTLSWCLQICVLTLVSHELIEWLGSLAA
jgi:Zn-dependent protease with chaperone function